MSTYNIYLALVAQLDKLARHNRQGSFQTKRRYYEAMQRFCRYLAEAFHLQKLSNVSGKHLAAYTVFMQESGKSASTVKTDLAAIRFFHDKMENAKYRLPDNDALGAMRLDALAPHDIQRFYNTLKRSGGRAAVHNKDGSIIRKNGKTVFESAPLCAKTVKNVHGVLHRALQQAVQNGYIRSNPTDACKLPRIVKKEFYPLDKVQMKRFLGAVAGHRYEILYTVTLFTGMREGEAIGLTWDCADFEHGKLTVNKQLQRQKQKGAKYVFSTVKNGKTRVIVPAPWVMQLLRKQKAQQAEWRLRAESAWQPGDFENPTISSDTPPSKRKIA